MTNYLHDAKKPNPPRASIGRLCGHDHCSVNVVLAVVRLQGSQVDRQSRREALRKQREECYAVIRRCAALAHEARWRHNFAKAAYLDKVVNAACRDIAIEREDKRKELYLSLSEMATTHCQQTFHDWVATQSKISAVGVDMVTYFSDSAQQAFQEFARKIEEAISPDYSTALLMLRLKTDVQQSEDLAQARKKLEAKAEELLPDRFPHTSAQRLLTTMLEEWEKKYPAEL